jgi:hypothetical protein
VAGRSVVAALEAAQRSLDGGVDVARERRGMLYNGHSQPLRGVAGS